MKNYSKVLNSHFQEMCKTGLFRVNVSGDKIWETYLQSSSQKGSVIFRDPESSVYNCNHCKNAIRRYGNIVTIVNGNLVSLFDADVDLVPDEYKSTHLSLRGLLNNCEIENVFLESYSYLNCAPYAKIKSNDTDFNLGLAQNSKVWNKEEADKFGVVKEGEVSTFHHFNLSLPSRYVLMSGSIDSLLGDIRTTAAVFKRGLQELSVSTLELVIDLIKQKSLLDGDTFLKAVEVFRDYKLKYDTYNNKDAYVFENVGLPNTRFRNTLMGVLCTEIETGVDLNEAVRNWNKRVDPVNFMKAVAPFSKAQRAQAEKFIEENGYTESFDRRFATIDDININEILHYRADDGKIKNASIFDKLKDLESGGFELKSFDSVSEVTIQDFMNDILPSCTRVEALFESRFKNNLVTLTTANVVDSKPIFKWTNNFSWTYAGNLAGKSEIKEAVKSNKGDVDGVLRFSIIWNENGDDILDYDAHCVIEAVSTIYYGSKAVLDGKLDIDMIRPRALGVENITFSSLRGLEGRDLTFKIENFSRNRNKGYKAEIEFDGNIYNYTGNTTTSDQIATVSVKDGNMSIKHIAKPTQEVLAKAEFKSVRLVCMSPNHWGENSVGNKHYFFMLEDQKTEEAIRSFHIENLRSDLLEYRKVLEPLGGVLKLEPGSGDQLTGLGFNATVRDSLLLRITSGDKKQVKRIIRIKF